MRIERFRAAGERGSILIHVMVTGVLIALIAAAILRMSMLRYGMIGRSANILQEKRDDQAALAAIVATWNANGTIQSACSGAPAGWTGCLNVAAAPANCSCTCTRTAAAGVNTVTVTASLVGGSCQLSIASASLP